MMAEFQDIACYFMLSKEVHWDFIRKGDSGIKTCNLLLGFASVEELVGVSCACAFVSTSILISLDIIC